MNEQEIKDGIKLAFESIGYYSNAIDFDKLSADSNLVEEYELDSVDVIGMVMFVEEYFEIEITDEEFYTVLTSGHNAFVELIQNKVK